MRTEFVQVVPLAEPVLRGPGPGRIIVRSGRSPALEPVSEPSLVDIQERLDQARARVRELQRYAPIGPTQFPGYVALSDDESGSTLPAQRPFRYGTASYAPDPPPRAEHVNQPNIEDLEQTYEQAQRRSRLARLDLEQHTSSRARSGSGSWT